MTVFNITSQSQLLSTLKTAKGGDILKLAAGDYGTVTIKGAFASKLTITSADEDNPATFDKITVKNGTNIALDHLKFEGSGMGTGLYVRDSSGISVSNSDFSKLQYGLFFGTSENVSVSGNHFTEMWHDAMRFAGIDGANIVKNSYIESGSEVGYTHKDFIQFWAVSANKEYPSKNIVITGNEFITHDADSHGIFLNNGETRGMYENITITNNYISTNHPHAITVSPVKNLVIDNNTVIKTDVGVGGNPTINVSPDSLNVKITNNTSPGIPDFGNSSWSLTGNDETGTKVWQFTGGQTGSAVSNKGGTGGSTTVSKILVPEKLGDGHADQFKFFGYKIDGDKTVALDHFEFADGDTLVLSAFEKGTLLDKNGGNEVWNDANGTYAKIDSLLDLQEIDYFSKNVKATVSGDDLLFAVKQSEGTHTFLLEGYGAEYKAGFDVLDF